MIRILCYGDSNTWGYISGSDHLRYDETNSTESTVSPKFVSAEKSLVPKLITKRLGV